MKTTIPLFSIVVAFLSVTISPQARAVCQEGCLSSQSTALGEDALLNTSSDNTAVGFHALMNTTGSINTAVGSHALENNTSGFQNTAIGWTAFYENTTGSYNTAIGVYALWGNTSGGFNTAIGLSALLHNRAGFSNTAVGYGALRRNHDAVNNTAIGREALGANTTGSSNIAVGYRAGSNLTTGNNNIDIGNRGQASDFGTIRIGTDGSNQTTFIAGISGATVAGGVGVIIDNNGHLGTVVSSKRYKDAIQPMDEASDAILALKPVTFRYKQELDPDGIPQFGLVAEDVEKVNPDLVARDQQGKPYAVRYEAVNAMLLNEFLKEHKKVAELEATISKLQAQGKEIAELKAALKQQTAQLQKVSAWLEANMPATRLVDNE